MGGRRLERQRNTYVADKVVWDLERGADKGWSGSLEKTGYRNRARERGLASRLQNVSICFSNSEHSSTFYTIVTNS